LRQGHAYGFLTHPHKLLTYGRQHIAGPAREPYTIETLGVKSYILTNPKDVGDAYRNVEALSFDVYLQATMRTLGCSDGVIKSMYTPLTETKSGFPNPNKKSLALLSRDIHIQQLFPGGNLTILGEQLCTFFSKHLVRDVIAKERSYTTLTGDFVVIPLMKFCSDLTTSAGQESFFGAKIGEEEPNLVFDFLAFDDISWQLLLQYPNMFCQDMIAAKTKVCKSLQNHFEIPMEERANEDTFFVKTMEAEMRDLGIDSEPLSILMMTVYWG
jgi:hypothetical protein